MSPLVVQGDVWRCREKTGCTWAPRCPFRPSAQHQALAGIPSLGHWWRLGQRRDCSRAEGDGFWARICQGSQGAMLLCVCTH